ncbi:MAG: VCBS repeat-containing protein [Ignavibacteria bacterium]|nr:VCBS repeat-containing protein [Ignavibacteria bacterium]
MNANSVVKSSDIVITFSQLMNGSLMTSGNIKVFGYQTGLMTASLDYNSVSNTLTINPVNEFKNGEKVSVTLTSGLKTISNETITPFVYSFRAKALGGTGTFVQISGISNVGSNSLKTGDIDQDGFIDLIVGNRIYKNNGLAVFTLIQELSHTGAPELADFDNDGYIDILLQTGNNLHFFKNNGTGFFMLTYTIIGGVGSIGDLNGDGFIDVAYSPNLNDVKILKNVNGVLESDTTINFILSCQNAGQYKDNILIDDYNNDGRFDPVSINGGAWDFFGLFYLCREFNQLKNEGNGIFISNLFFTNLFILTSSVIYELKDSKSFDFNNDRFIDIVSSNIILTNNGDNTFTANSGFIFSNTSVSDFNGDGYLDIVSNFSFTPLYTNLNDGQGNFIQMNGNNDMYTSLAEGDFDNDGDIDIAAKEFGTNNVAILLNGDSPMPVELSSFTFSVNLNSVKLNWSTSLEQNNSGFEIQRSDNDAAVPEAWKKAGFVNGAGNSSVQNNYTYEDKNLSSGKYKYRLKQIDFNGGYEYFMLTGEAVIGIPSSTELQQNYPNPFNPVTNISYRLSESGFVTLKVFDNSGREVKTLLNEYREAGYYKAVFDGSGLASGIYFYKLAADNFNHTKKLSLVK